MDDATKERIKELEDQLKDNRQSRLDLEIGNMSCEEREAVKHRLAHIDVEKEIEALLREEDPEAHATVREILWMMYPSIDATTVEDDQSAYHVAAYVLGALRRRGFIVHRGPTEH